MSHSLFRIPAIAPFGAAPLFGAAMAQAIGYKSMDMRTGARVRIGAEVRREAAARDTREEFQNAGRHQDRDRAVQRRGQDRDSLTPDAPFIAALHRV
jgi:hypothetical protein